MRSPLKTASLEGIVTVNLATKAVRKEYLYSLANPAQTKVAVSEITVVSNAQFLVDERDGELQAGGNKKIYIADVANATDVGQAPTCPAVCTAPIDKLRSRGVTVASKMLKLDLGALLTELNDNGHDTIEGLVTPDGGKKLVIANDRAFGLAGIESRTPPFKLKPKTLANGAPGYGRVPCCRHHQTAAADPATDGIRQGRLTYPAWARAQAGDVRKCQLSAVCWVQTRAHAEGVVAWSGDSTS